MNSKSTVKAFDLFIFIVFVFCLAHAFWALSLGFWQPLTDSHDARQTFTALITRELSRGSSFFAYNVPLLGPPWVFPHELPLMQKLTALVSNVSQLPIDQTGRLVNILFYLLCSLPIYLILKYVGVSKNLRWIPLTLFYSSPFYLYWSRTFMMESFSVFWGLIYLYFCLAAEKNKSPNLLAGILCAGLLSALMTPLTFLGFTTAAAVVLFLELIQSKNKVKFLKKKSIFIVVAFIIPFLSTLAWSRFADYYRSQLWLNGQNLLSSKMTNWYLGPWWFRFQPTFWNTFQGRITPELLGFRVMGIVVLLMAVFAQKRQKITLFCLFLFIWPMFVVAAAHQAHNYYQYANGLFELGGVAFGIIGLLESRKKYFKTLGIICFVFTLFHCFLAYHTRFKEAAKSNYYNPYEMAELIQKKTKPNSVLLIQGWNMNPVLPYYSDRRAIDLTAAAAPSFSDQGALQVLKRMKNEHYEFGALALCWGEQSAKIPTEFWKITQLNPETKVSFSKPACDLYF